MKVNIKTIKDEKFVVEVPENATIGELKGLIETQHQHQKDWQILIFSGTILTDDKTIESIKMSDKDFLVLMIKKPREVKKPAPAAASTPAAAPAEKKPEAAPAPAAAPVKAPEAAPAPAAAATPSTPAPAAVPAAQGQNFLDEASMMVSGPEANEMINNLCEMGFPRDQVILALRASYFNPHRAVEYLFSGNIPAVPAPAPAPVPAQPAAPSPARPVAPATPAPAAPAAAAAAPGAPPRGAAPAQPNPFDFLRSHPQFQQMRQIAMRDPAQLEQLLMAIAEANPEMIGLITEHQDEFIRLLTSPEGGSAQGGQAGAAAGGLGGDPLITPGPRPGTVQVQVTQADMESINNLVAMGFDRNRALEAYIVFGRNVDAAANYLLSNPEDDPMDAGGDFGGFDGDDGDDGDNGDDDDMGGEDGPTDF